MKTCSHCFVTKQLAAFHPEPRYAQGVHSWCRDCIKAYGKSYRAALRAAEKPRIVRKHCSSCNFSKPVEYFSKCSSKKDGYASRCKMCRKRSETPKRKESHGGKRNHLWSSFRMRADDFNTLLESQGGVCAICEKETNAPTVDHCHVSGNVRGLLCYACNSFLGRLENKGRMERFTAYLEKAKTSPLPFRATAHKLRWQKRPQPAQR